MDNWRVSVRAEDALARGRLQEDALEFFLLVFRRVCRGLKLPVFVGSKQVGREVGRQENATKLATVMEKWRQVWPGDEVRKQEELLLMVVVDERTPPQDWMCVSVRSVVKGQKLGEAKRLVVGIHDSTKRPSVAKRVARNIDVLVRGVTAAGGREEPDVEFLASPKAKVSSQRVLCAFGMVMRHVADAAGMASLDTNSESFIPDVSNVLRSVFGRFRTDLGARGLRDVDQLLTEAQECRAVLERVGTAPALVPRRETGENIAGLGGASVPDVGGGHADAGRQRLIRVATWNVAGGKKSDDAPATYSMADQEAYVAREISRWVRSYGCDVIALQECEFPVGEKTLLEKYELVGSAAAKESRGFVQLYVRRGMKHEEVSLGQGGPCVAVRLCSGDDETSGDGLVIVAVHLPSGPSCSAKRLRILKDVLSHVGDGTNVVVAGDMNAKDDEIRDACKELQLQDARYVGATFGAQGNRFDHGLQKVGCGARYDRVLFGKKVWAESHVVGNGPVHFEGSEFWLSDHCGLLAYVDFCDAYGSKAKQDVVVARARRGQLVSMREQSQQKELVEVKARRQQGREEQALARRRVAERDRAAFQRVQRRGARQRHTRRERLKQGAFGADVFFGDGVVPVNLCQPCAPSDVSFVGLDDVPSGAWRTTSGVPLIGIRNLGLTCYVSSFAQVLIRTPAMLEWMQCHSASGCANEETSCVLCALWQTYCQMLDGTVGRESAVPVLAGRRRDVDEAFGDGQHDVVEFLEKFFECARAAEVQAFRCASWDGVEGLRNATHFERIFGFVQETRRRCMECNEFGRPKYSCEMVLRLAEKAMEGGPLSLTELYYSECGKKETDDGNEMVCEKCLGRRTRHEVQTRMITAPNVLVIQIRRRVGVRSEIAVEDQLELPGMPVMELVGVVYHNGVDFDGGHYTCLCRGPGAGFWFYDDKAVHKMHKEVAHVKPRGVVMAVYCRRDGGAVWKHAVMAEEVMDLDGAGQGERRGVGVSRDVRDGEAMPGSVSGAVRRSPVKRRLSEKTSVTDAGETRESGQCKGQGSEMPSPKRRRLNRKTSVDEAEVAGETREAEQDTVQGNEIQSPQGRRLDEMTGVEHAGAVGASPSASSRLRRKTSVGADSPCGAPRAAHTTVPGKGAVSGGAGARSSLLKRRRGAEQDNSIRRQHAADASEWVEDAMRGSSSVDMEPSLAEHFQGRKERRQGLLRLSDEDLRRVLQQFLVSHSATGEVSSVVAEDVERVREALLFDERLAVVLRSLLGASLLNRGADAGDEWLKRMVDEFIGRLHMWETTLGGPRRLGD